jgi:tetratricopeptide (TPR) repeat protein
MHLSTGALEEPPAATAARGRHLAQQGRLEDALAALLSAVERDERLVDAHLGIYEVAQILRREELALAHQRRAIALAPVHSGSVPVLRPHDAVFVASGDEIAIAVQESGEAVISTTRVGGRLALRACFINHRSCEEDVDALLDAVRTAARTTACG